MRRYSLRTGFLPTLSWPAGPVSPRPSGRVALEHREIDESTGVERLAAADSDSGTLEACAQAGEGLATRTCCLYEVGDQRRVSIRMACIPRWPLAVLPADGLAFEVVLGATAAEEFGGFGATVLARAIEPDLVICLDATYESPEQRVLLGKGPVLTLSDASVLISPAMRDLVLEWFHRRGLLLQTEVYNVSGTDARAFPKVGLPAPVLALLIATRGNHSPAEVANLADYASLREVLLRFAVDPPPLLEA